MTGTALALLLAAGLVTTVTPEAVQEQTEPLIYAVREQAFNPFQKYGIYENMKIVYKRGDDKVVLTAEDVVDWVRYWPDGHWDIDDDKIAEFVSGLQEKFDSWGGANTFTTTMGEEITITQGDFGWQLNRSKEIKEISRLLRNNGTIIHNLHFSSKGADEDDPDAIYGDTYVEIDLSRQVLWMYEDGEVVLISNIVSGMMNTSNETPSGAYTLKGKQSPAVLVGENYQTPVSYWMPFNGGIGLHDATWQNSFGGDVCYYNGSHGCINLPLEIAGAIYERIETGCPIICYYSDPEDE